MSWGGQPLLPPGAFPRGCLGAGEGVSSDRGCGTGGRFLLGVCLGGSGTWHPWRNVGYERGIFPWKRVYLAGLCSWAGWEVLQLFFCVQVK